MAQIDIDKFVISLMRYFGNNKGIVTTLDRCLFSLGLKYVDTPTGGRLERVDQPTMLEKIMWGSSEQNPEEHESCEHWSDEQTRINLLSFVNTWGKAKLSLTSVNIFVNYLEKQGKQKPAWSEEDVKLLDEMYKFFDTHKIPTLKHDMNDYAKFIKLIKERVQPKQECSEEDEQYLLICKNALAKYQVSDKWDATIISRWLEDKLKSLRPQNTWKPSDEHIHWLKWAINRMPDTEIANDAEAELRDLLEQLNKLREE